MDELRLILLGAGVVVIALIYLWGMRKHIKASLQERRRRAAVRKQNEPQLMMEAEPSAIEDERFESGHDTFSEADPELAVDAPNRFFESDESDVMRQESELIDPQIAEEPEMTVLLTVIAPQDQPFPGLSILEAAQEANLKLNKNGILDCLTDTEAGRRRVFRVGHLKEPGAFKLDIVESLETPGLLIFLHLPGPLEATAAVDKLIAVAGQLARRLGGMVCDERQNKMTTQAMVHLRTEAAEFERQRRVWAQLPRD